MFVMIIKSQRDKCAPSHNYKLPIQFFFSNRKVPHVPGLLAFYLFHIPHVPCVSCVPSVPHVSTNCSTYNIMLSSAPLPHCLFVCVYVCVADTHTHIHTPSLSHTHECTHTYAQTYAHSEGCSQSRLAPPPDPIFCWFPRQ